MRPFVIITTQRSGSGLLTSLLNSHPEITCYHELLLNDELDSPYNFYNYWLGEIGRDPANLAYHGCYRVTDRFLERTFAHGEGAVAVGFNIKYNHLAHIPWMLDRLQAMGVGVIHLIRWNLLKTHVSEALNQMQAKLGRKAHGTSKLPTARLALDAQGLVADLERRAHAIETFRTTLGNRFDCLELCYEDLTRDRDDEGGVAHPHAMRLYEFLGLRDRDVALETELRKTNPDDLAHVVTNYDESAAALRGTRWEYLLDHKADNGHLPPPSLSTTTSLNDFHALSNALHRAEAAATGGDIQEATRILGGIQARHPGEPSVLAMLRLVRNAVGGGAA